ncbi:MAG: cohesin domain-containing protein, partial [Candidatus Desantisbacteria bacterium]
IFGNGFGSAENIVVSLGTTPTITTGIASNDGSFMTTFAVNVQPCGITTITAKGISTIAEASSWFNIRSNITFISPICGTVGCVVRVMGSGFGAAESVRLSFGNVVSINILTTDESGRFDSTFIVNTQAYGTKTIMAAGLMSGQTGSNIFYLLPNISFITPTIGTVGSIVTVAGSGYGIYEQIRLGFGNNAAITHIFSDGNGMFTACFTTDTQAYGTTTIAARGDISGLITAGCFKIMPNIILLTPTSGQTGSFVTMIGNGFGSGEVVNVDFGTTLAIVQSNAMAYGRFQIAFTTDNQPMGTTTLTARGLNTNIMCSRRFVVCSSVTLKITPAVQNVVKGQEFTAQVDVVNVSQLVTADIYIDFNPDILEAVSVGSGTFIPDCNEVATITNGRIKYSFGIITGSPVSGSGTICLLRFKAKERGVSNISIDANQTRLLTVVNEQGVDIPYAKQDAACYVISGLRIQPQDRVIKANEYVAYQCISDGELAVDVTGSSTFTTSGGGELISNIFHAKYIGSCTITASYLGLTCTTSAIIIPGTPTAISYVSGNNQANTCTLTLNEPFVIRIGDTFNNPCLNVDVSWQVSSSPTGAAGYSI